MLRLKSPKVLLNTAMKELSEAYRRTELRAFQGPPGFLGIQYFGVFDIRYTVFLCLKLGIKYYACFEFWYKVYLLALKDQYRLKRN